MTTLGQIVGIHKGNREAAQRDFDVLYHTLQKGDLFIGFDKIHEAFENNLPQPDQKKHVQANAHDILVNDLEPLLTRLLDLTATKDHADTLARADVKIGNRVIIPEVPVNHLLWLEKQAVHLLTVFRSIPVLSATEDWQEATGLPAGMLRTPPEKTPTTKKVEDWKVIVQATEKFPAQAQQVKQDVQSGWFTTVKFTTAVPAATRDALVRRASLLLDAIRQATVAANHLEVTDVHEGEAIFGYLYEDLFE